MISAFIWSRDISLASSDKTAAEKPLWSKQFLNLYQKDSGNSFDKRTFYGKQKKLPQKTESASFWMNVFSMKIQRVETNARCFGSLYSRYNHRLFLEFCRRFDVDPKKKSKSPKDKNSFSTCFAFSHDANVFLMDEPSAGLDLCFAKNCLVICRKSWRRWDESSFFHPHHRRSGSDWRLYSADGSRTSDIGFNGKSLQTAIFFYMAQKRTGKVGFQIIICQNFGEYRNSTLIDSAEAESLHLAFDRHQAFSGRSDVLFSRRRCHSMTRLIIQHLWSDFKNTGSVFS